MILNRVIKVSFCRWGMFRTVAYGVKRARSVGSSGRIAWSSTSTTPVRDGRIVWLNGDFVHEDDAKVSIFDRGVLQSDAIYEVVSVIRGKLLDKEPHLTRLETSLAKLNMPSPMSSEAVLGVMEELVSRNNLEEGIVYLQVSRGVAPGNQRVFGMPQGLTPNIFFFTQSMALLTGGEGISVKTVDELRWARRDIKTTQLLGAAMAKQAATDAGADDAWFVDSDGFVLEGTTNNCFIVTNNGTVVTRQLSNELLPGCTRGAMIDLIDEAGYQLEERKFSVTEAKHAAEAFITSAGAFAVPVVTLDGSPIGNGAPGPVSRRLRELYIAKYVQ